MRVFHFVNRYTPYNTATGIQLAIGDRNMAVNVAPKYQLV